MRLILTILAALTVASIAEAGPRQRRSMSYQSTTQTTVTPTGTYSTFSEKTTVRGDWSGVDALAEVNAARAARGLPPFLHDPALTSAAQVCASIRAAHRIAGHTANDFAALPPGVSAAAAGCGALDSSWGWATCCTYDRYTYAGAAVVVGADGRRFMHLFVR